MHLYRLKYYPIVVMLVLTVSSALASDTQQNREQHHLRFISATTLPANAKGVLFHRDVNPLETYLPLGEEWILLRHKPWSLSAKSFMMEDTKSKRRLELEIKKINLDFALGRKNGQRFVQLTKEVPDECFNNYKNSPVMACALIDSLKRFPESVNRLIEQGQLEDITQYVHQQHGLFRIEAKEGFKIKHRYRLSLQAELNNYQRAGKLDEVAISTLPTERQSQLISQDAEFHATPAPFEFEAGPEIKPDTSQRYRIQKRGLMNERKLDLPAEIACKRSTSVYAQDLDLIVPSAYQAYSPALLTFWQVKDSEGQFQYFFYLSNSCTRRRLGDNELPRGQQIVHTRISNPTSKVVRVVTGLLEFDDDFQVSDEIRIDLKP